MAFPDYATLADAFSYAAQDPMRGATSAEWADLDARGQLKASGDDTYVVFSSEIDGSLSGAYWTTISPNANCEATVKITSLMSVSGRELYLQVRMSTPGNNATANYYLVGFRVVSSQSQYALMKVRAESWTELRTWTNCTFNATDSLGISCMGGATTTLQAWRYSSGAWAQIGTDVVDDGTSGGAAVTAAGYFALVTDSADIALDDFSIGGVAGGEAAALSVAYTINAVRIV